MEPKEQLCSTLSTIENIFITLFKKEYLKAFNVNCGFKECYLQFIYNQVLLGKHLLHSQELKNTYKFHFNLKNIFCSQYGPLHYKSVFLVKPPNTEKKGGGTLRWCHYDKEKGGGIHRNYPARAQLSWRVATPVWVLIFTFSIFRLQFFSHDFFYSLIFVTMLLSNTGKKKWRST